MAETKDPAVTTLTAPAPHHPHAAPAAAPPVLMQMAERTHRAVDAISADLDAAKAELARLEPVTRDQRQRRVNALNRRRNLEITFRANPDNSGLPFEPELYNPPAYVPGEETPETKAFHDQHYVVAKFERELEDAKKALTGR